MLNANLFTNEQHGYVPNRDCTTNLLLALEDWAEALEFGYDIDVIYTDFGKAFDSVPHNRLLLKLKSLGIEGDVLKWIKSFLTGRRHRVTVDGVQLKFHMHMSAAVKKVNTILGLIKRSFVGLDEDNLPLLFTS